MKNTLENKFKFFGSYWGTNCAYVSIEDAEDRGPFKVNLCDWKVKHEDAYLALTPLSQISDEDAIFIQTILEDAVGKEIKPRHKNMILRQGKKLAENINENGFNLLCSIDKILYIVDYLRSKGYALPYLNYSIEDLVEMKWIVKN